MSLHTVLSFLLLALLATCYVSLLNYDGFTIDMIHRDSLVSSLQNSKPSNRNLLYGALQRSKRRADYLASGTPTADVLPSGGEFLVKLSVGTLPFEVSGILDTTSSLSWTQCAPCTKCFPQKQPLFTPNKSSSYKVVAGNSKACKSLGGTPSTSGDNLCRYSLLYQLKYHSRGVLSSDTITMKTTSGVGPSSLITQMNPVTGGNKRWNHEAGGINPLGFLILIEDLWFLRSKDDR
ncbi:aspartic proteinase CDR1-like isoform X3 [Salvia splendens]|uniref:aspartic proteinase CDR1-like isoform X3 n=1 Tax=Salvia splendens TaxID=180675 RepID=UPI001C255815|nr:aspartic proteinase CDR1-like isoform X3 [Salvia splendens]